MSTRWAWHTGELVGNCRGCDKLLRLSAPCIAWQGHVWHVDCALTELTAREAAHSEQTRRDIAAKYGNYAVPP